MPGDAIVKCGQWRQAVRGSGTESFRVSGTESLHFRLFQAFVQAALRFSPRLAGLLPNPEPVPQVA
ncbi:hypothetical protein CYB_0307 [Synechococcus sp. JA-2-3B'a(2-13)]|nr:hypothetical protein CYB_0307 [Synechococcus sp. JA-2-3B'a(2-13)]